MTGIKAALGHGSTLCSSMIYNCTNNCSGHGDCYDGVCVCEVQFSGGLCREPNISYYVGFSLVFYIISLISFIQLLLCIKSEFSRMKTPSILGACRVTTQKAIYLLTFLATGLRGFYFSSPNHASLNWTASLMTAYYPIILTGSSIIVCFWAEVFHLDNLSFERPGFLSKSIIGFVAFNLVTYSVLITELLTVQFADISELTYFSSIFKTCYALLMLVLVVFFLFYGVEVFFKMRCGFLSEWVPAAVNVSQLQQSRLGLISQAMILLLTVCFILSDSLSFCWKDKVPVISRNAHHVLFRMAELGAALWFPCVLWNCFRPEKLWILNPKQLLLRNRHPEIEKHEVCEASETLVSGPIATAAAAEQEKVECWICYDPERTDAGPLIQPCLCKGDVSAVHHDCLKKWLIESSEQCRDEEARCKVCNQAYEVSRGQSGASFAWRGLGSHHWVQTAAIVTVMTGSVGAACVVVRLFDSVGFRTLAVGAAVLTQYVGLKLLGFNLMVAYNRAKYSAIEIMGRKVNLTSIPQSLEDEAQQRIVTIVDKSLPSPSV